MANILVTEHDVISVKIGDNATVSFNALTGTEFPAKITQIAPLATVQQGVVNYQVTVELTSLTPVFPNRTGQSSSPATSGTSSATAFQGHPLQTHRRQYSCIRATASPASDSNRQNAFYQQTQSITLKDGFLPPSLYLSRKKITFSFYPAGPSPARAK